MSKPMSQTDELKAKLPESIREAFDDVCDTSFECGEWNANDSDELYETVHDRAAVAKQALIQGILSLIQGDASNQGDSPAGSSTLPAPSGDVEVEFRNVTITVRGHDAKAAYARLCELFEIGDRRWGLEYTTDLYVINTDGVHGGSTTALFPDLNE